MGEMGEMGGLRNSSLKPAFAPLESRLACVVFGLPFKYMVKRYTTHAKVATLSMVLLGQLLTTFMMDTLQDGMPARLLNISMILFGIFLSQQARFIRSRFQTHAAQHVRFTCGMLSWSVFKCP